MLVIHIISKEDTKEFSTIYRGLEYDTTILINPSKDLLRFALNTEKKRILIIGHGTENGLLNSTLDDLLIDSSMVRFLRGKEIIGIWCFASNFASKHNLNGFFTSMFISNCEELIDCGFNLFDDCDTIISNENQLFSCRLNLLIRSKTPISEWADSLRKEAFNTITHPCVKYNYEAMYSSQNDDLL